ncbi:hypothetical protein Tco_1291973 [Tanacetum coccineum]
MQRVKKYVAIMNLNAAFENIVDNCDWFVCHLNGGNPALQFVESAESDIEIYIEPDAVLPSSYEAFESLIKETFAKPVSHGDKAVKMPNRFKVVVTSEQGALTPLEFPPLKQHNYPAMTFLRVRKFKDKRSILLGTAIQANMDVKDADYFNQLQNHRAYRILGFSCEQTARTNLPRHKHYKITRSTLSDSHTIRITQDNYNRDCIHRRREKRSLNNNSFLGEYECSSFALDRRRDEKENIGSLETRSNNVSDQEI